MGRFPLAARCKAHPSVERALETPERGEESTSPITPHWQNLFDPFLHEEMAGFYIFRSQPRRQRENLSPVVKLI